MSDAAAFAAVTALIGLITDPKAAKARLDALQKAAAEIETAQAQLEAARIANERAFAEARAELDRRGAELTERTFELHQQKTRPAASRDHAAA
jgi:predicted  nucleic acid-binding Zn-ribbon protein